MFDRNPHSSDSHAPAQRQNLIGKFRCAFRGLGTAWSWESNFKLHLLAATLVIALGYGLRVGRDQWCLLAIAIAAVLAAETFNCSIEQLAKAITREQRPEIGRALDMASAAVLIASLGAAVVGAAVFVERLGAILGWWSG